MKTGPKPKTLIERFLRFVDGHAQPYSCLQWRGQLMESGYGKFGNTTAHRAAYTIFVGDPGPNVVDHLCRNRSCVNPFHLDAVPQVENARRGLLGAALLTHCKRGHEFTPENTIVGEGDRPTRRRCRTCKNDRQRKGTVLA